jgi:hypothetical protein
MVAERKGARTRRVPFPVLLDRLYALYVANRDEERGHFRVDFSDMQTIVFAGITKCSVFQEFPDSSPCGRTGKASSAAH